VSPKFEALFAGQQHVSFDLEIRPEFLLRRGAWPELDDLLRHYYDEAVMTKSLLVAGPDVIHGFAGCGLPLVLEHNAPNNSLGILWAESPPKSSSSSRMRPLFRRRQRHL
jgi:hypothetical protein